MSEFDELLTRARTLLGVLPEDARRAAETSLTLLQDAPIPDEVRVPMLRDVVAGLSAAAEALSRLPGIGAPAPAEPRRGGRVVVLNDADAFTRQASLDLLLLDYPLAAVTGLPDCGPGNLTVPEGVGEPAARAWISAAVARVRAGACPPHGRLRALQALLGSVAGDFPWDVQVLAFDVGDRRFAYLNFLGEGAGELATLAQGLVRVCDGGAHFFQLFVDLGTGQVLRLDINGEA